MMVNNVNEFLDFFEYVKQNDRGIQFFNEVVHFLSACIVKIQILKNTSIKNLRNLNDVDIKKKEAETINNEYTNNVLKYDEQNNIYYIESQND